MALQENYTQTDKSIIQTRRFYDVTLKHALQFIAHLLLPLMLGIFTVAMTINQQNMAREQRAEDQKIAELQRDLERKLNDERYQNDIRDAYIKEMGELLKENNGSLMSNPVTAAIARGKTLNIFRELDSQRKARIIQFLVETKQLSEAQKQRPLDLSTAELHNIDFRHSAVNKKVLSNIALSGVFLRNATFMRMELGHATFSESQLDDVNFSLARLTSVKFSSAQLRQVDFSFARLNYANFLSAQLDSVNFTSAVLTSTDFRYAQISRTSFEQTSCTAARFDHANLSNATFRYADAKGASFIRIDLINVDFSHANLYKADFTGSNITDSQLRRALSVQDAKLPNGTLARDPNLINNGQANCNVSVVGSWKVEIGNVTAVMVDENITNCQFTLQSVATGATMSQLIDLSSNFHKNSWPHSQAVLNARMSIGVSIHLRGINSSGQILVQQNFRTKDPASAPHRHTAVHLFEWKWKDIADECIRFLGPSGYAAIQVSPASEHAVFSNHPWWQRYQPVSYKLESRSGNETEFKDMVTICNSASVRRNNGDQGPPSDDFGNTNSVSISNLTCTDRWICEHRWRQIYNMVGFRNTAKFEQVRKWWDNGNNQIAFGLGDKAFIAINNDNYNLSRILETALPTGRYCDVISGQLEKGRCTGKIIMVQSDGKVEVNIADTDEDPMIAIHINAKV
ncbi:unnamed protein product [Rotaria sp. Silwood2]|nr:unnamed protein product [Rotaria sp. Silwood2]CAF4013465.1 unnamed protein product [Rotaria sp. Silwood2]